MKKILFLILVATLVGCSRGQKTEVLYVNNEGQNVYRAVCKKDPTKCMVKASKICDGRYNIIEWIEQNYFYRPTHAEAAIMIVNTVKTKNQSQTSVGQYSVKEGLIFSCKK